jgi:hypothetical protein
MRGMQCNVEFGYQLSICSRTEENHGKPEKAQQNNASKFGSYIQENTRHLRHKDQSDNY